MNITEIALDLIHRLTSSDPHERHIAAEEVTDVMGSLGDVTPVIALVLAAARLVESDPDAQEAQLHTLDALNDIAPTSDDVVRLLAQIDPASITGSQVEYMEFLLNPDRDNVSD